MAEVLIINPPDPVCGVASYGESLNSILQHSEKHGYTICTSKTVPHNKFDAVIINYHEKLFPWLCNEVIESFGIPCMAIGGHDCYPDFSALKFILNCDSTSERTERNIPLPRPIRKFIPRPNPIIPTIGSCGFSFNSKNFQHVASVVAQSFDEAVIRLQITLHPHGDPIENIVTAIRQQLHALNKPKIEVQVSTHFLSDDKLIEFLSENTANVFLYPPFKGENRGLSSAIDKALAARKPIAISDSDMYRHINMEDKFLLSKNSLAEIISFGTGHLESFLEKFSEERLIEVVDSAVDECTCS